MKILFIFTGGTIGSTCHGNVISPSENKPNAILEAYKNRYGITFDYATEEPYTELSENITGEHLKRLVNCVRDYLNKDFDGIIVTHGTDTIQYSAAALGYAIGLNSIPVCIVSANRPIENSKSNALDNLHAAIKFIEQRLGRGVFVPYRNDNDTVTKVHRATRLLPSRPFSDEVASMYDQIYGEFNINFEYHKNSQYNEFKDNIEPLDVTKLGSSADSILFLSPYVGMQYPTLSDKTKYVILSSYHSGTVNTKDKNAIQFFLSLKAQGIKTFITGIEHSAIYESATLFDELGIIPLRSISPIAAYVKLWILSCDKIEPTHYLNESLGADIAP